MSNGIWLEFYGKEASIVSMLIDTPLCAGMCMSVGRGHNDEKVGSMRIESREKAVSLYNVGETLMTFGYTHEQAYDFRQRMREAMDYFDEDKQGASDGHTA